MQEKVEKKLGGRGYIRVVDNASFVYLKNFWVFGPGLPTTKIWKQSVGIRIIDAMEGQTRRMLVSWAN